jgi:hypothetical protein
LFSFFFLINDSFLIVKGSFFVRNFFVEHDFAVVTGVITFPIDWHWRLHGVLFNVTVVDAASSTRLVHGLQLLLIVSQQKERFSALATSWFQSDRTMQTCQKTSS